MTIPYCFTIQSLTRAHPHKRPALVTTTFSNFRGGRLREHRLYFPTTLRCAYPMQRSKIDYFSLCHSITIASAVTDRSDDRLEVISLSAGASSLSILPFTVLFLNERDKL